MIMASEEYEKGCIEELAKVADDFFSPQTSPLRNMEKTGGRPFEYRPQQLEMSKAAAEAFSGGNNLCVEAPTGVGKSFAYLVPALCYSLSRKRKTVITTETINLQEQLIHKDIPSVADLLKLDVKTALAKGRSNFLCLRRLFMYSSPEGSSYIASASIKRDLERLVRWAHKTKDGSLADIDFKISSAAWPHVCSEGGNCAGPKCNNFRSCFYWKARRQWDRADIIVANHALFFTDLKMRQEEGLESSLLPEYSAVIVDEAHTVENNAAQYLGLNISGSSIYFFLRRLYNPASGKGLLTRKGADSMELRRFVAGIHESSEVFFSLLGNILDRRKDSVSRINKPGVVPDLISEKLALLKRRLLSYAKELEEEKDLKSEIISKAHRAGAFSDGIFQFLNMSAERHVYWLERTKTSTSMTVAPLNVNEILAEILFRKEHLPVILTSATLAVNGKMDYYRGRTGYSGGPELVIDSPFDFQRQVRVYVPQNMPEPTEKQYLDALASEIKKFISMTRGKAFVLFTSYKTLEKCAGELATFFHLNKIQLLVQGGNMSRSAMLKEFREDTDSVIFGTASFWTGVDVPGEALSNVIITRLPFAVPTHPLIRARSELIEQNGLSSFMNYALPEAVLKFKQGVGRLIRSRSDKGIIAILDNRVISKRYGRVFLDSIPASPMEIC